MSQDPWPGLSAWVEDGEIRITAWYLLLVAVLGILSRCKSLRDLERYSFGEGFAYAIRHHSVLTEALGIEFSRPPSDSAFRYFFRQMDVAALVLAISQACYATGENHERAVLTSLFGELDVEGVLIQADVLHTQRPFFNSLTGGSINVRASSLRASRWQHSQRACSPLFRSPSLTSGASGCRMLYPASASTGANRRPHPSEPQRLRHLQHEPPARRPLQFQAPGLQPVAAVAGQGLSACQAIGAVEGIAQQRRPHGGAVDADLVGPVGP